MVTKDHIEKYAKKMFIILLFELAINLLISLISVILFIIFAFTVYLSTTLSH